jgi:DNA mismatch endonuclease Vsr
MNLELIDKTALVSGSTKGIGFAIASQLAAEGAFLLHRRDLPGSPDVVLLRYQAVVFVNGCFWHGHSCPHPYHVREEAGTHRYNVGTDTPKLCATSCAVVPLANSFLAALALLSVI